MKSFFSRFKENLNADYGGRYMEVILQEILFEDITYAKILFPHIDMKLLQEINTVEVKIEDVFKKNRRADLVIRHRGIPIACLEIKYEDKALDNQLEDYIKFAKRNNVSFTYLTQYNPPKKELDLLKKGNVPTINNLLYSDLYKKIIQRKRNVNPVVKLFCKFLEENVMIFDNKFLNEHEDVVLLFLIKGLTLKHNHGFGRKVSEYNMSMIPDLWEHLIENSRVIGSYFTSKFPEHFAQSPVVNFSFTPWFDKKLLSKDIQDEEGDYFECSRDRKKGGYFQCVAQSKFKQKSNDAYLYISLGYHFAIDLEDKSLKKYFYVEVFGKNNIEATVRQAVHGKFPSEDMTFAILINCVDKAITKCLKARSNQDGFRKYPKLSTSLSKLQTGVKKILQSA